MKQARLLVVAAAFALYARTLGHFFVSDDFLNLERSTFRTLADGLALFSTRGVDFYRPLARVHFGVMAGLFSDRVLLWNVANLLLHALVCLAVLALSADLLGRSRARTAAGAALLFAVHYLHVEPVVWASGIATLLVTLGILLALLLFRRSRVTGSRRDAALSVAAFAGALMSQETAVAFVPLLLVTTWAWPPGGSSAARRPSVREAMPYAVLLFAYAFVATSIDRGGAASPYRYALGAHVLKNVAFFAVGGFVPVPYWRVQELWAVAQREGGVSAFATSMALQPSLTLPLLAGVALLVWAWIVGGGDVRGAFAWVAAASTPFLLLPGSGERFQYLSSFGACLALALGVEAAFARWRRGPGRRLVPLGCVAMAAWIVGAAVDRENDWLLASRWTRGLVDRWGYFQIFEPTPPVEFVGVPDHWRSAWVFRNGFSSMVRLYWEGRGYWREEERPPGAPAAYRMQVLTRGDGSLAVVPAPKIEGSAPRPELRDTQVAPGGGVDTPPSGSYSPSRSGESN